MVCMCDKQNISYDEVTSECINSQEFCRIYLMAHREALVSTLLTGLGTVHFITTLIRVGKDKLL